MSSGGALTKAISQKKIEVEGAVLHSRLASKFKMNWFDFFQLSLVNMYHSFV